jgi:hypothetical protein
MQWKCFMPYLRIDSGNLTNNEGRREFLDILGLARHRPRSPQCGAQELKVAGEVVIESGYAPVVVSKVALWLRADLLVIGRGRESVLLGRLRANAYAIVRESPCPVVTIPLPAEGVQGQCGDLGRGLSPPLPARDELVSSRMEDKGFREVR